MIYPAASMFVISLLTHSPLSPLPSSLSLDLHAHQFVEKSFRSPTYCGECENFIYGLARQGVQCQRKFLMSHSIFIIY